MKKTLASLLVAGIAAAAALATSQDKPALGKPASAQQAAATQIDSKAAVIGEQLPSYPLTTCVVSGHELAAGETVDLVHEGRLYRLCCNDCAPKIEKDAATFAAKIDAAVIAAQTASYPLDVCAVSGEKLGGMGEPYDYVHGTRLVRFCCDGCVKGFQKAPAESMAKIDKALIAAQLPTYPLKTCLISGEELGDDSHDRLYGVRLVRLCCKGCTKEFDKDPAAAIAKLDEAAKTAKK